MITVSNELRHAMETRRNFINKATVTLADGTVLNLTNANFCMSGNKLTDSFSSGEAFSIGNAIAKSATMKINNTSDEFSEYDFFMAIVVIYVGMKLDDGTIEYIRKGTFTVTEPETPGSVIELSLVDDMYLFDRPYDNSTLVYPATLQSILSGCCLDCGVTIGFTQFDLYNQLVSEKPSGVTYRQVVSYVAQLAGYNARISTDNALELVWYDVSALNFDIIDGGDFNKYSVQGDISDLNCCYTINKGIYTINKLNTTYPLIYDIGTCLSRKYMFTKPYINIHFKLSVRDVEGSTSVVPILVGKLNPTKIIYAYKQESQFYVDESSPSEIDVNYTIETEDMINGFKDVEMESISPGLRCTSGTWYFNLTISDIRIQYSDEIKIATSLPIVTINKFVLDKYIYTHITNSNKPIFEGGDFTLLGNLKDYNMAFDTAATSTGVITSISGGTNNAKILGTNFNAKYFNKKQYINISFDFEILTPGYTGSLYFKLDSPQYGTFLPGFNNFLKTPTKGSFSACINELTAKEDLPYVDEIYLSLLYTPSDLSFRVSNFMVQYSENRYYDSNYVQYVPRSANSEEELNDFLEEHLIYDGGENTLDGGNFTELQGYHNLYSIKDLKVATDDVVITGVSITVGDTTKTSGEDGYMIAIKDNPLATGIEQLVANHLATKLVALTFRPFSCKSIADPRIEVGDVSFLHDRKGNTYKTIITDVTFTTNSYTDLECKAESPLKNSSTYFSQTANAVVQARRNTEKQLTTYDLAVQSMNMLAQNAMGAYWENEIQEDNSIVYFISNKKITKTDGICHFIAGSKIWKMTGDGFFLSQDGGLSWTSGFDSNGNAVFNILNAIGINCDWINAGTLTLGGSGNVNGLMRVLNASGSEVVRADYTGLKAIGADITGKITATSGSIGGFDISDNTLSSYGQGMIGVKLETNTGKVSWSWNNSEGSYSSFRSGSSSAMPPNMAFWAGGANGIEGIYVTNSAYTDWGGMSSWIRHGSQQIQSNDKGYVTWSGGSDARIKRDVVSLENIQTRIFFEKVEPKIFKYTEEYRKGDDKTYFGVIAQDMEKIFDDLEVPVNNIVTETDDNWKFVNYQEFHAFELAGIKDLYETIDKQQAEIDELKKQVKLLIEKVGE